MYRVDFCPAINFVMDKETLVASGSVIFLLLEVI